MHKESLFKDLDTIYCARDPFAEEITIVAMEPSVKNTRGSSTLMIYGDALQLPHHLRHSILFGINIHSKDNQQLRNLSTQTDALGSGQKCPQFGLQNMAIGNPSMNITNSLESWGDTSSSIV